MKPRQNARAFAVFLVGLFLSAGSRAAPITTFNFNINDLTDGATITDFNNSGRLTLGDCTGLSESCSFSLSQPTGTSTLSVQFFDQSDGSFGAVLMTESADGPLSDFIWNSDAGNNATFWVFQSDNDSALSGPNTTNLTSIIETGASQQTFRILYRNSDSALLATDIINVRSDVDAPEPAAACMTFGGLALVGWISLRRKAAN